METQNFKMPNLRKEEWIALRIRALFEEKGYGLFRMGSFEEYDFYMQNRPFLKGEDVISFTGMDGRLMALKPDMTLSIVKNTQNGEVRRVYYNENVYRRSHRNGEYCEIHQMGLENIGAFGIEAEADVLRTALESLAVIGKGALDLSHMEFIEAMLEPFGQGSHREDALQALKEKSPHGMCLAAEAAGLCEEDKKRLMSLAALAGPFAKALEEAKKLAQNLPLAEKALQELSLLQARVGEVPNVQLRLDFSILNDIDYYNGLIFQGFIQGLPQVVLAGGRYDNLMRRFEKKQPALGFALYLDALEVGGGNAQKSSQEPDFLNIALPKGRLGDKVYALFEKAGLSCEGLAEKSRKLVFEDKQNRVRYFLVKPTDVDIYVEHGAADIGVVGKDVLLESGADVLDLLDLHLGKCRLAVAGRPDFVPDEAGVLRVASKYPNVTRRYYAKRDQAVEIIKLNGSIELAPITGLSDVIVDIVETGSTLHENNLDVLTEVAPSSARLIANRASWRFKGELIQNLAKKVAALL